MNKIKNRVQVHKMNFSKNTIVVELSRDSLTVVELANRNNGAELVRFAVRSFPAEGLQATWLKAVWHHEHFSEPRVVYCLSPEMVEYKSLVMPMLPLAQLEEGVKIEFENSNNSHSPKLVKVMDWKSQDKMFLVNAALVNSELLSQKIQLLKDAGLEVLWTGLRFQGLRNFINFNRDFFEDAHSGTVYIDFDEHQSELGIIQDDVLLFRRGLDWGGVDFQDQQDLEARTDFQDDIRLMLAAYQAETKLQIPKKLIPFNTNEATRGVCDILAKELGFHLYVPEKTKLTGVITGIHTRKLAPLIGLALDNAGVLQSKTLKIFTPQQEAAKVNREKLKIGIYVAVLIGFFLSGIFMSLQANAIRGEQTGKWLQGRASLLNSLRLMERETTQNTNQIKELRSWLGKQNRELEFLLLLQNNLPDGTQITDLTIENGLVKDVSGVTPSASLLLNKIKTVPGLENLKLKGTISSSLQGEIFQLEGALSGKGTLP